MADLSVIIPYTPEDEHLLAGAVASVDIDCEIVTFCDTGYRGAGWARNRARERASCEWLCKLDADDRLAPGTLSRLWSCRAYCGITATRTVQFQTLDGALTHSWDYSDTSSVAILTRMRTPASAGTFVYHVDVGEYPEDCGAYEGWAFVCRAVRDGIEVVTITGTSYFHIVRDGSYWPSRHPHRMADLTRAFIYVNELYAEAYGG